MTQKMMYCGLNSTTDLMNKAMRYMMTPKQIQQMFSEKSDGDEYFGFESILLILVPLVWGFDSLGVIGPRNRCILYTISRI